MALKRIVVPAAIKLSVRAAWIVRRSAIVWASEVPTIVVDYLRYLRRREYFAAHRSSSHRDPRKLQIQENTDGENHRSCQLLAWNRGSEKGAERRISMVENFKELWDKMSREARFRSETAEKMISEIGLAELREAMDLTQKFLANAFT